MVGVTIDDTLKRKRAGIVLAGRANNFSTPPVSFQCISLFVGGARSRVVIMSLVSESWAFISSPDMFFTSSTISLRLRFAFVKPARKLISCLIVAVVPLER